jgi:hypothetical protein
MATLALASGSARKRRNIEETFMAVLDLVSMDPYLCVAALLFEAIDATKMHATACRTRVRVTLYTCA